MTARLLLSPSAAGKTAHVIDRIRAVRAGTPLEPIWVVLPNAPQVGAFRRRLAHAGGALNVTIGTFYAYFAEINARAGRAQPKLDDPVQYRVVREAIERLAARRQLPYYAPIGDKPGLVTVVRNLIEELKRARIEPAALAQHPAVSAQPRLAELAAVYGRYQRWLLDQHWADSEGEGWIAESALANDPRLGSDVCLLIVDGFDEFNPTQLDVLRRLSDRIPETIITLTGTPENSRSAHRRYHRARTAITAALKCPVEQLPPPRAGARALALGHIEAALFEPQPRQVPALGAVEFVEAATRAAEVRAAMRWIKARLQLDGMSPDDVALIARDVGEYQPFVEEAAGEFGVPVCVDGGHFLSENPAIAALLDLLALPLDGWPYRGVIEAWRSPYFAWETPNPALTAADADALAAVARAQQVVRGLEEWRSALDQLAQSAEEPASDEPRDAAQQPRGDAARALRAKFDAFVETIKAPEKRSLAKYVSFVEELIGDDTPDEASGTQAPPPGLRMVQRAHAAPATASRDAAALIAFKDVLRALVLADHIRVGNEAPAAEMAYADFMAELSAAVEAAMYEVPHARDDAVLATPILRARGLSFRAVALIGLAEREFPRAEQEDILLRESDRLALREAGFKIDLRLRGEEGTLFYEAVTRARERLLLTRPYLADDGQAWEPSPYWEHLRSLVAAPLEHLRMNELPEPSQIASLAELLVSQAAGQVVAGHSAEMDAAWSGVRAGVAVLQERMNPAAAGPHEGDLSLVTDVLAQRFGPAHRWSISRLETFGTCPFFFYAVHVLGLETQEPPAEGFDAAALGSIYHELLRDAFAGARDPSDAESVMAALDAAAGAILAGAPARFGFRPSPWWGAQQVEILEAAQATVSALVAENAGFTPAGIEQVFDLPIKTSAGTVRLHGRIDRVDEGAGGEIRVIDYKTGSKAIADKDLDAGQRLQLPIYAYAAQQARHGDGALSGYYWHIGSAKPSSLKLDEYDGGAAGAIDTAMGHVGRFVAAIRSGQFEPVPPAIGCPSWCPATAFCWRYTPGGR